MLNSQFSILIGWELRIEHWSDLAFVFPDMRWTGVVYSVWTG
jgi:hypothetical protein